MKIPASLVDVAARAFVASINITANVPLAVPASQPPFSKLLDPLFTAFSLEFQYWPTYAGNATAEPNQYVNHLLGNLWERTGKTPAVRVGGTSENTAYVDTSLPVWDASQLDAVYGPFTDRPNTTIGRDWYVLAGNLPRDTELTFGINLYEERQVDQQSKMIAEAFQGSRSKLTKDVTLKSIQVGNEPNFYYPDAASYVNHWKPLAKMVLRNVQMGGHGNPTLWIGSEVIGSSYPFQLTGTLEAGILDDDDISNANFFFDEHQYSGALGIGAIPGGPPPGTLMNKASIRGNLSTVFSGMVNTNAYDKTYILGEANDYANEGIFGLSNTGESAIWAVDYMLKAASIGVSRIYLHSTPNRMFSVFQPGWGFPNGTGIERPHIMPKYNGLLVVDEMIGTSGHAMAAEIENNNPALATYGVWEHGKLARIVLANSNVFEEDATMRSALNVTLGGGFKACRATVKRLSIPYTTATEGITWAGQSFETHNGKAFGHVVEEHLDGLSITVAATEVVLISFK